MVPSKKGLSFVAVRDYVLDRSGRAHWAAAVARLPKEDGEIIEGVVGVGWYPLDLFARVLRAVDREIGTGDLSTIAPMGRFEAERDVPTIHRVLLKMVRPAFIVEKMAELWPRYNSTGRLVVRRLGAKAVDVTLDDWSDDEALCASIQGYSERALQLAGARQLRLAQTACKARGAPACVFHAAWE
jgi:predicted hydrocarbon binding protein